MPTFAVFFTIGLLFFTAEFHMSETKRLNEVDVSFYREKVKKMFYHAYEGYLKYAYPYDELQPLTCKGFDTWGSYSLTLIDALDTLAVIGNNSEFQRIANIVIDKGENIFDQDINVSVFETNIRIVGGLLSAHSLMKRTGMQLEPAWPCSGPLLRMAESIARRLLPAFDTPTGMPYGTVNLRFGVPKGETSITCTAGVGTFIIEFGTLSRLTGDPIFEKTAIRAIRSLWKFRSPLGLLGNHIDVKTGKWTALDSGIGGGVDSYFEYLVKGSILFNLPELLYLFRDYEQPIKKYLKRDDWYMWAHMVKGSITLPMFTSLDAFWPGIQTLLGDVDAAMKTIHNFHQVWRQFGATPEYYNIPKAEVHKGREGYPLRPELIESIMYLYRATKDPILLEMGVDIVEAIERTARTSCGYATIKDVRDHRLEDRMESFFLAETAKYLYLLFDPDNFIHNNGSHGTHINTPSGSCIIEAGGYVFNTEAHPIDLASVYCCSAEKQEEDRKLEAFHSNLDLLTLTGLVEDISELADSDWPIRKQKKEKRKNVYDEINVHEDELGLIDEDSDEENDENEILDVNLEEILEEALLKQNQTDEISLERDAEISENKKHVEEIQNDDSKISKSNEDRDSSFSEPDSKGQEVPSSKEKEDNTQAKENEEINSEKETNKNLQSKTLQAIDLSGLTDLEQDVAKIFLEQLNLDPEIVDFSSTIARKIESEFKGTEYENVATFISKQLMQVKTIAEEDVEDVGEKTCTENKETPCNLEDSQEKGDAEDTTSYEKSTFEDIKLTPDSTETKDAISDKEKSEDSRGNEFIEQNTGSQNSDKTSKELNNNQENIERGGKEDVQSDQKIIILLEENVSKGKEEEKKEGTNQQIADGTNTQSTSALNPALQRLKEHLETQLIQQYQQINLENGAMKQGKLSNLESKRANFVSLTTKLLNSISTVFTGGGLDDDESSKVSKASLAGLYKTLAGYPLHYFNDPSMMHCPAQPFHSRLSVYGEMFEE